MKTIKLNTVARFFFALFTMVTLSLNFVSCSDTDKVWGDGNGSGSGEIQPDIEKKTLVQDPYGGTDFMRNKQKGTITGKAAEGGYVERRVEQNILFSSSKPLLIEKDEKVKVISVLKADTIHKTAGNVDGVITADYSVKNTFSISGDSPKARSLNFILSDQEDFSSYINNPKAKDRKTYVPKGEIRNLRLDDSEQGVLKAGVRDTVINGVSHKIDLEYMLAKADFVPTHLLSNDIQKTENVTGKVTFEVIRMDAVAPVDFVFVESFVKEVKDENGVITFIPGEIYKDMRNGEEKEIEKLYDAVTISKTLVGGVEVERENSTYTQVLNVFTSNVDTNPKTYNNKVNTNTSGAPISKSVEFSVPTSKVVGLDGVERDIATPSIVIITPEVEDYSKREEAEEFIHYTFTQLFNTTFKAKNSQILVKDEIIDVLKVKKGDNPEPCERTYEYVTEEVITLGNNAYKVFAKWTDNCDGKGKELIGEGSRKISLDVESGLTFDALAHGLAASGKQSSNVLSINYSGSKVFIKKATLSYDRVVNYKDIDGNDKTIMLSEAKMSQSTAKDGSLQTNGNISTQKYLTNVTVTIKGSKVAEDKINNVENVTGECKKTYSEPVLKQVPSMGKVSYKIVRSWTDDCGEKGEEILAEGFSPVAMSAEQGITFDATSHGLVGFGSQNDLVHTIDYSGSKTFSKKATAIYNRKVQYSIDGVAKTMELSPMVITSVTSKKGAELPSGNKTQQEYISVISATVNGVLVAKNEIINIELVKSESHYWEIPGIGSLVGVNQAMTPPRRADQLVNGLVLRLTGGFSISVSKSKTDFTYGDFHKIPNNQVSNPDAVNSVVMPGMPVGNGRYDVGRVTEDGKRFSYDNLSGGLDTYYENVVAPDGKNGFAYNLVSMSQDYETGRIDIVFKGVADKKTHAISISAEQAGFVKVQK